MTIKGLKQFLKKKGIPGVLRDLSHFSGKCLVIDSSIPLYKYVYMSHQWGTDSHLQGFMKHIEMLKKYDITPIYVFDGRAPESKQRIINERKEQQRKSSEKLQHLQKLMQLKESYKTEVSSNFQELVLQGNEPIMRMGDAPVRKYTTMVHASEDSLLSDEELQLKLKEMSISESTFHELDIRHLQQDLIKAKRLSVKPTRLHVAEIQSLMESMNVRYIQANGEADPICAQLCKNGIAQGCLTEDMDILTYGCSNLLTGFTHGKSTVTEFSLQTILSVLNFSMSQFVDFCILCGCDHYGKIKNIGPVNAFKLIGKHHSINNILDDIISNPKDYKTVSVPEDFTRNGVELSRQEFMQDVQVPE